MMERSGKKRKDKEERMVEDEKGKRKTGRYTTYMCMCEKERKREILYYVKKKKEKEETKEDLDR